MQTILFNKISMPWQEPITLAELLRAQGYVESGFAVAINQEFMPRAQYEVYRVQAGDKIDVMVPMQGG